MDQHTETLNEALLAVPLCRYTSLIAMYACDSANGYGIPSAIPTTLQAIAGFALGDASENKLHPVAVRPFMAFNGNASGQVNACAAVHKTAAIAASGILLLKPLARLFITTKSPHRGNSIPFHKNPHDHCFVSPLLWLAGKQTLSFGQHTYYTPHFRNCKQGRTIFLRFFGKWKRHPCEAFNAIA